MKLENQTALVTGAAGGIYPGSSHPLYVMSKAAIASLTRCLGRDHPVGRTGITTEVAALVLWLASAEVSFVTGQVWVIDGGRTEKASLP